MAVNNQNAHEGHRDRLRKKFINSGFDNFEPHEILELYLFYAIPRRDTNVLAHKMLDKYGSLGRLCDAPMDSLMSDFGISYNTAVLLKMLPELSRAYTDSKVKAKYIDMKTVIDVFRPKFIGATTERLVLALSDARDKLILCDVISTGSLNSTDIPLRKIMDLVLRNNAKYAYLAHNHPSGISLPSKGDLETTEKISKTLFNVGVLLVDHIIFSDSDYTSLRANKTFKKFFCF